MKQVIKCKDCCHAVERDGYPEFIVCQYHNHRSRAACNHDAIWEGEQNGINNMGCDYFINKSG